MSTTDFAESGDWECCDNPSCHHYISRQIDAAHAAAPSEYETPAERIYNELHAASPEPTPGLRAALDAWEKNGAPNRRSLAAFGIRPVLATAPEPTPELREFFGRYLEHHPDAQEDEEWCMKHLPTPAEFRAALAASPAPEPTGLERHQDNTDGDPY